MKVRVYLVPVLYTVYCEACRGPVGGDTPVTSRHGRTLMREHRRAHRVHLGNESPILPRVHEGKAIGGAL